MKLKKLQKYKFRNPFRKRPNHIQTIGLALAVVLFWRGAWGIMDLYLFPQNPAMSFCVSIILSIAVLLLTDHLTDELL